MHSAWIGEHHFDSLGVNSCPHILLASIIPLTKRIRLAPAVAVLPLQHPLRVAEEYATLDLLSGGRVDFAVGRGYDRREYVPFGADYMDSLELLDEGSEVILKAWNSPGPWSHKGRFFDIPEMTITPRPVQQPIPFYMACFSQSLMDIAARHGTQHHLRPVRRLDDVRRPRRGRAGLPRDLRQVRRQARPRHVQLLHPHRRDAGGGRLRPRKPDALLRATR